MFFYKKGNNGEVKNVFRPIKTLINNYIFAQRTSDGILRHREIDRSNVPFSDRAIISY